MDYRTSLRTHACGDLRKEHAGDDVVLCGWVARDRDHGGVTFIDLRDRTGLVQLVLHPEEQPEAHAAAAELKPESVARVKGRVRERPEGTVNADLPTGEIEVVVGEIETLSLAATPPFPVEDRVEAEEGLRLKYRYLDLRRPEMTRVFLLRSRVNNVIRDYLESRGFIEIETPFLTRSTPEGARDFLVPSRLSKGSFYALPQSPQLFKQILMVAGFDRYFQIVRCFRDEAFRADRQPEFTQLDLEMSFVTEEDVYALIEGLMAEVFRKTIGVDISIPFTRLAYADAIGRYGSDKPDLRYGMELAELGPVFEGTGFRAFASAMESGGVVKGFAVPGGAALSRNELDGLVEEAKRRGAAGLVWAVCEADGIKSPVEKHLSDAEVEGLRDATGANEGDLILIVADRPDRTAVALDGLRRLMAARMGMIPEGEWSFAWIVDPPMFEWSEEEKHWVYAHHPFTAPAGDDLAPETAKARAYDLVLNGYELSTGSIRISDPEIQRRVFEVLGLTREEIDEKFGFLLDAFRFGVPPHGGIAPGLDRLVMLLAGKDNLRDVIAFPKTQSGSDPLTGAPAPVDEEQLRELGILKMETPEEE
ncbi:MAG: aspartate--tRNA ligase [Actinomycetota bacterium]